MALHKRADTHNLWAPMRAWVGQCVLWLVCVAVCPVPLCAGLVWAGFAQSASDPEHYWDLLEGKGWKVKRMIWLKGQRKCGEMCVFLTDCYSLQPSMLPSVCAGLSLARTSVMVMEGVSQARRREEGAWRSSKQKDSITMLIASFRFYWNMLVTLYFFKLKIYLHSYKNLYIFK